MITKPIIHIKKLFAIIVINLLFISISCSGVNYKKDRENICSFLNSIRSRGTNLYRSFTPETIRKIIIPHHGKIKKLIAATDKGYLDDEGFLYDNALCLFVLIDNMKYKQARKLLKIMEVNFETTKNGKIGLLNSYNIDHFDFFFPTKYGEMNKLVTGIDGEKIYLGPNMFIGLAAQHYFFKTKSLEFIDFICKMFNWVQKFKHFKWPNGMLGGPSMGWGWNKNWQEIISTENIIDYYAFIKNFLKISGLDNKRIKLKMKKHEITIKKIKEIKDSIFFFMKYYLYNTRGTFNRGSRSPIYVKGEKFYMVDTVEALDCNSWAICGFGIDELIKMEIDPYKLMENVEKKFAVEVKTSNKQKFSGFDFTTKPFYIKKRDIPVIWWEGTGGVILAYRLLEKHAKKRNKIKLADKMKKKYLFYINEMNRFSKTIVKGRFSELPYIHAKLNIKNIMYTFNDSWTFPIGTKKHPYVHSIASTVWRYFAVSGFNPFNFSKVSND